MATVTKKSKFMEQRYGYDTLTNVIFFAAFIFLLLSLFVTSWFLIAVFALIIYGYSRVLSKNKEKRAKENRFFLDLVGKVSGKARETRENVTQSEDYNIFPCPNCDQKIKLKKSITGIVTMKCPKCDAQIMRKV